MKKLKPIIVIIVIIGVIITIFLNLAEQKGMVTLKKGNFDGKPLPIELHHYQDSQCGMVIDSLEYASEVIAPNGNTWFFHDHGGMVKWLEERDFKDRAKVWVYTRDTKEWIDAKEAYYTRDESTPMRYGFGAYKNRRDNTIPFEEMRILTLRGETMRNPKIRQQLIKSRDINGSN
ncbi:MAG: hypothetical protein GXO06_02150 [Epsilonproteobacteria bacterium]|jgi:hypothetical protein|nr:hypothetical protein [Campylobacterota bacterium]